MSEGPLGVGGAFPDAVAPHLDGESRRLSEAWRSAPALVVFGHADCGTTRLLLPHVARFGERGGKTASVLAVLQESVASARALLDEMQVSLPGALDGEPYPLAASVGLRTVPTSFVVETDGRVADAMEGFDRAWIEAAARRLGVAGPLFDEPDAVPARRPG